MSLEFHAIASGSSGNAYLVTDGPARLLIDPGIAYKQLQRELDHRVTSLDGALISHSHLDHCCAAGKLMEAGVNCYARRATWDAIKNAEWRSHRARWLFDGNETCIGPWHVRPFDVPHDVPCIGFLVTGPSGERLCYVTDAAYVPFHFREAGPIKIFAIEANFDADLLVQNKRAGVVDPGRFRRTPSTHMSIDVALEFFRANDMSFVERIVLLHLSADNSNAQDFKRRVQEVTGRPCEIAGAKDRI